MNPSAKQHLRRFFILAPILYIFWFAFYELWFKPHTNIDEALVAAIIKQGVWILDGFGFKTYSDMESIEMRLIGVDGAHPVWIGNPCNALTLFSLFSIFIIAFPGPWKSKLWFIPMGIIIIHLSNLIRVLSLVLINYYAPSALDFNHTYTFTVFVYGIIFLMWMWWVNKFAGINLKPSEKN